MLIDEKTDAEQRKPLLDMLDPSPGVAFINGQYCTMNEARIPIRDWGLVHADATYDVVSVWKGSFFRLEDHLDRFHRSLAGLMLQPPHNREEIRDIVTECVRRSGLRDAYVVMACTRGVPPPGIRDPRACVNTFFAYATPYQWVYPPEKHAQGIHLMISQVVRIPPESVDPTIKNYHRGDLTHGLFEAYDRGVDSVLLVDFDGNITEGPGFNIFAIRGERVTTPGRTVLEGITRRTVFELFKEIGMDVLEQPLSADDLRTADEALLTSTAGGVTPVSKVDDQPLGNGTSGPISLRIRELYWSKRESGWHATPVDYG